MIKAAGILFVTKKGRKTLLLRRSEGDHKNEWAFPGGKIEDGETAEQAAVRETVEEAGNCPKGNRAELCFTIRSKGVTPLLGDTMNVHQDQVRFTTFVQIIDDEFQVKLNDEHDAHMWCSIDELPSDMHPGALIAIKRFVGNEIDIAKMVAYGELPSPQQVNNMWLFDLRITGTGTSYRDKHDEIVYRPPENYLTPDFLDRCFGLPVIINHPAALMMQEEDYVNKNVGSIRLPYIKGDEVWGIASIYDQKLAKLMQEVPLSTSPGVVFKPQNSTNQTFEVDGTKFLIEGKAGLLDHLAICPAGVWDKGGPPLGVNTGEVDMPDNTSNRQDEDALGKKLDKVLEKIGELSGRMDSIEDLEKARAAKDSEADTIGHDAFEARKDGESDDDFAARRAKWEARKDGESDDAYKARMDASPVKEGKTTKTVDEGALSDAANNKSPAGDPDEVSQMRADNARLQTSLEQANTRLSALERNMPKHLSDEDHNMFGEVQARADSVMMLFGKQAPRPLHGESISSYRRRLASNLKQHSKAWSNIDLNVIKDDKAFVPVEDSIYNDAMKVASEPDDVPEGTLREIRKRDLTGREMISFVGQPYTWMKDFSSPARRVTGFTKDK